MAPADGDADGDDEPLSKREQLKRRRERKKAERGTLEGGTSEGDAHQAGEDAPGPDRTDVEWVDLDEATIRGADDFGWRYVYWGQLLFGLFAGAVAWALIAHLLAGGGARGAIPHVLLLVVSVFAFGVYLNNLYKDAPLADYSKVCPACGGPVNRYSEFCEHCGTDLVHRPETTACPGCGEEVWADVPYCGLCGHEVAGPVEEGG